MHQLFGPESELNSSHCSSKRGPIGLNLQGWSDHVDVKITNLVNIVLDVYWDGRAQFF